MTLVNVIRNTAAGLAGSLLLASAPAFAVSAPAFSGLYVLGDSLSDIGRVFAASGGTFPPPPYFQGRFSNGPVAVEHLAAGLGLGTGQFVDLAVGGARTGLDGSAGAGTGMLSQLAGLQAALPGGQADPNALYFVWGGANDLRNGVSIGEAIGNLGTIVSGLHTMGARKFLLPNLPDLGLTPEAREAGSSAGASFVSGLFNQNLAATYSGLAAQWSDETFYYFDAMNAQRTITNGAPGNGFSNVSAGCLQPPNALVPTVCGTPGSYLYWDQIHPTAAAHQILGNQMLAAVPEPQTLLMMAVGLLGLLAATRRRQA